MRSDFEQLLWLYSMGVEDVTTRQPQNYYNVQLEYICDSQIGAAANQTYLESSIADVGTDPTSADIGN